MLGQNHYATPKSQQREVCPTRSDCLGRYLTHLTRTAKDGPTGELLLISGRLGQYNTAGSKNNSIFVLEYVFYARRRMTTDLEAGV